LIELAVYHIKIIVVIFQHRGLTLPSFAFGFLLANRVRAATECEAK
jgi:hypothetical protein